MANETELSYEEWRAQIEAEIAALEAELASLTTSKEFLDDGVVALECLSGKLRTSSDLFKQAGTIGGIPLDKGKAVTRANQLDKIGGNIEDISETLATRMSEIEAEIERLRSLL